MRRLYVMVEGQTEEAFVNNLLGPCYAGQGLYLIPFLIRSSPVQSGGIHRYQKVRPQIEALLKQEADAWVTTLLDLYALPNSFPGKDSSSYPAGASGQRKAEFVEQAWAKDMSQYRFIPNLLVHEFEALLFSDVDAFEMWTDDKNEFKALQEIGGSADPEDINDGPQTAPSKRILTAMPAYDKTFHGPLIASDIGLDKIRARCPHFDGWLRKIDALVPH